MARLVHELMNPEVVCAYPSMSASEALKLLLDRGFVDAPVVDDGRIVGIISQAALVRHVETLSTAKETGRFFTDDEGYRELSSRPGPVATRVGPRPRHTSAWGRPT